MWQIYKFSWVSSLFFTFAFQFHSMKRFFLCFFLLLTTALPGRSDGIYNTWFEGLDTTRFLLVDKQGLTLSLVGPGGRVEQRYGIACAVNMGNKERKRDHRTPEGRFPINQILNSGYLSHDFRDGKGPIPGAYGPWFLRLDVPGFIDIGIHGTHLPESIGSRATEGCIRMRNDDILDLKERVAVGMPVVILPDTLSLPADSLLARLAPADTIALSEDTESLPTDPSTEPAAKRPGLLLWILLVLAALAAALLLFKRIRHK
jgi:hypothetical protein